MKLPSAAARPPATRQTRGVMATARTAVGDYPHIEKTPCVCGGKACITGTRIRALDIIGLRRRGFEPSPSSGPRHSPQNAGITFSTVRAIAMPPKASSAASACIGVEHDQQQEGEGPQGERDHLNPQQPPRPISERLRLAATGSGELRIPIPVSN